MNNTKKKIAIVNVLFPPNALGGATRIAVDEISTLIERYENSYEIVVFTSDIERRPVYEINVYPYNGYRVYAVSAHVNNWIYQDEKIGLLFDEFLAFEKPDLVHFHCIQVLTGSIVEATQKRGIPHLVTVHDAWWISDHQFLFDNTGKVYQDGHPDPFEKINLPDDITLEMSVIRRSYLKRILNNADVVLAVSDTYRRLYEKNGIMNTITNKNGIADGIQWRKKETGHIEKVVCAFIGGMSAHKGFYIFQDTVKALGVSNLEILIVDHTKPSDHKINTVWGKTPVTIIGHINQSDIADLYERIDVLFAPSICPESFGLVTREAVACGCWIVASNLGGIGEDITPENGFKITPTKESLLSVLNEINRFPKKYKGLSKSGGIRYSSDQVNELVEIINNIFVKNEKHLFIKGL